MTDSDHWADRELATLLLAFFRRRLRTESTDTAGPQLPRYLVRRTLDRLDRQDTADGSLSNEAPASGLRAQKGRVLRAALMELRRLEESSVHDGDGPCIRRN